MYVFVLKCNKYVFIYLLEYLFVYTIILYDTDQGSVEGIDYELKENRLYWTNSNASISKIDLSLSNAKPEIVLQLSLLDRPRGIAIDICDK